MLALAAQTAPVLPLAAMTEDEIVVTARKLSNRWTGSVETANGTTTCKTVRSTGDAEFDVLGCQAMLTCWPQIWPQIVAQMKIETDAGRIKTKEDLQRAQATGKLGAIYKSFGQCVTPMLRVSIRNAIKQRKAQRV